MMNKTNIGYYFLVMASIVIVLAGIKSASEIIVPFLLALFLAIIISPSYNYFNKKGLPSFISLILVISLLLMAIITVGKLLGSSVNDFTSKLPFYEQQLSSSFDKVTELALKYEIEIPQKELSQIINSKQIINFSSTIVQSMGNIITNSFVILLTAIFMLLESTNFSQKIISIGSNSNLSKHLDSILTQIKEYMVLKSLISLLTGFIVFVTLSIVGTDYPLLWAIVAFGLNFIPNIGSIIAAVPAVLLTLIQFGLFSSFIVAMIYVAINVIIGSIIEPKVMGKGLGLSTLVVFLSLIFWGWLLGMVGMLLSIPLTIMIKIILDSDESTKWISILLGTGKDIKST